MRKVSCLYHIIIFIGTRPEIIRMAPIIRKIKQNKNLRLTLVHSGQHYDYKMSNVFLEELGLNQIDKNLEVGSGSHAEQTAKMLRSYEDLILKSKPDIVLAQGDTNSVVAAGIVCAKLNVPFGHVEAGIRSYDMTMPEEINRRISSIGAAIHFAPTKQSILNLYYEGIDPNRINFTGNTIVDATLEHISIAKRKSKIFEKLQITENNPIIVATIHRPVNVDNIKNLRNICKALENLSEYTIVFPVHPRTLKQLKKFRLLNSLMNSSHIFLTEPLGYTDFLYLMEKSEIILTDSGGIQEEAITLRKPCVTLRLNTERPETVKLGINYLVGSNYEKITTTIRKLAKSQINKKIENIDNPFGDGKASERIVNIVISHLEKGNMCFSPPNFIEKGSAEYKLINLKESIKRKEFEEKYNAVVTLVYDENGQPHLIPKKIPKGWYVRILF